MRLNFEETLLRNPALTAAAFWHFSRSYMDKSKSAAPELPHFFIAGGMLFHQSTIEKASRMNFDSGLLKLIAEKPDLIAELQARMEENWPLVLKALQVGCSAKILCREGGYGFPQFRAEGANLPTAIRTGDESVPSLFAASKRLGCWFAMDSIPTISSQLRIKF
jgi:hypothetical protein